MYTMLKLAWLIIGAWNLLHSAESFDIEPIVKWHQAQTTVYADSEAKLILELTQPLAEDLTVGLHAYGVGLSVTDDIDIPENMTILAGYKTNEISLGLREKTKDNEAEAGNRLVRIRIDEILFGKASLGGVYHPHITDVHFFSLSTTGCHSGSFVTSKISVFENVGSVHIPFIVNEPFSEDHKIGYVIDFKWTGATTVHAEHEVDYIYHVQHHHQGDDKYVILKAGETSVSIPITIIDDNIPENAEQFLIRLDHKCLSPLMNILGDSVIIEIEDNDHCPDVQALPFVHHHGVCYFRVESPELQPLSQSQAQGICDQYKSNLVTISNDVENAVAAHLIPGEEEAWIGAERGRNDTFVWHADRKHVMFDAWGPGQPAPAGEGKDCVTIKRGHRSFIWSNTYCDGTQTVYTALCKTDPC